MYYQGIQKESERETLTFTLFRAASHCSSSFPRGCIEPLLHSSERPSLAIVRDIDRQMNVFQTYISRVENKYSGFECEGGALREFLIKSCLYTGGAISIRLALLILFVGYSLIEFSDCSANDTLAMNCILSFSLALHFYFNVSH